MATTDVSMQEHLEEAAERHSHVHQRFRGEERTPRKSCQNSNDCEQIPVSTARPPIFRVMTIAALVHQGTTKLTQRSHPKNTMECKQGRASAQCELTDLPRMPGHRMEANRVKTVLWECQDSRQLWKEMVPSEQATDSESQTLCGTAPIGVTGEHNGRSHNVVTPNARPWLPKLQMSHLG